MLGFNACSNFELGSRVLPNFILIWHDLLKAERPLSNEVSRRYGRTVQLLTNP